MRYKSCTTGKSARISARLAVIGKMSHPGMGQVKNSLRILTVLILVFSYSSCNKDENPSIDYPETGFYGENILFRGKTEFTKRVNSLQAKIPKGKSVKIKITGKTATGGIVLAGVWYYDTGTTNNWAITTFDISAYTQTFSSIDGGLTCDAKMMFDKGTFQIDYFENNSSTPTSTKTITVNY